MQSSEIDRVLRGILTLPFCLFTAYAQPIDASDDLILLVNPPRPVSGDRTNAATVKSLSSALKSQKTKSGAVAEPAFRIEGAEIRDGTDGTKDLEVIVSHSAATNPDPSAVRIYCCLYETDERGDTQLSASRVVSNWTSAPVDWTEDAEEKLVVRYPGPTADSGRKYEGYTIAVYFNDELQDVRASSDDLLSRFPHSPTLPGNPSLPAGKTKKNPGEAERFLSAYKRLLEVEKSYQRGNHSSAKSTIKAVISDLNALRRDRPDWEAEVVEHQLDTAKALLAKIEGETN